MVTVISYQNQPIITLSQAKHLIPNLRSAWFFLILQLINIIVLHV